MKRAMGHHPRGSGHPQTIQDKDYDKSFRIAEAAFLAKSRLHRVPEASILAKMRPSKDHEVNITFILNCLPIEL